MKKSAIVLLILAVFTLFACGRNDSLQTAAVTMLSDNLAAQKLTSGIAITNNTPAIQSVRMRGDVVEVVGEYDDNHYVVQTSECYGIVEKGLLRSAAETPYESWVGYSYINAEVYDNYHLMGTPIQKLPMNTRVAVLDDLGYGYVVQASNITGFMSKSALTKWPSSSGGGSGSGSGGSSSGADGGDIILSSFGLYVPLSAVSKTDEWTGQAVVLADGTEIVLYYYDRGEQLDIVSDAVIPAEWEGYACVYINESYGYVPKGLFRTQGMEAYEAWNGFSLWNGVVYDNYYLLGDPSERLYTNYPVKVLDELDNCYLVEVNGKTGFMSKEQVSKFSISSGKSGGEWSPPAM